MPREDSAGYLSCCGGCVDRVKLERLGATRMRQYVRAWINEWDLVRLHPDYQPATEVVDVPGDYREVAELDHDTFNSVPAPTGY